MGRKKKNKKIVMLDIRDDVVEQAVAFVTPFVGDLAEWITDAIIANDDSIRLFFSAMANICVGRTDTIRKFEWVPGECFPWDQSGELESAGHVDINEPLEDFLEEYSGGWEATYTSGHGKNWKNILDDCDTLCVGEYFLKLAILRVLDEHAYTDDEKWAIRDTLHDTLYRDSWASDFIFPEVIIPQYFDEDAPAKELFDAGAKYTDKLESEYRAHFGSNFSLWDAWLLIAPEFPEIQLTIPELPEHIKEAKLAFQKKLAASDTKAEG